MKDINEFGTLKAVEVWEALQAMKDADTGKRLELISKLYRRGYMDGARDAKNTPETPTRAKKGDARKIRPRTRTARRGCKRTTPMNNISPSNLRHNSKRRSQMPPKRDGHTTGEARRPAAGAADQSADQGTGWRVQREIKREKSCTNRAQDSACTKFDPEQSPGNLQPYGP